VNASAFCKAPKQLVLDNSVRDSILAVYRLFNFPSCALLIIAQVLINSNSLFVIAAALSNGLHIKRRTDIIGLRREEEKKQGEREKHEQTGVNGENEITLCGWRQEYVFLTALHNQLR